MASKGKLEIMTHYSKDIEPRISFDLEDIKSGLIKEVGYQAFLVYTVLASYSNSKGVSYPSQNLIGESIGMGATTVRSAIHKLEAEGYIKTSDKGRRKVYLLKYHTAGAYEFIENEEERKEVEDSIPQMVFTNANDVASYFAKKYQEVYGVPYTINFGRDLSLIKDKLLRTYTDTQLKTAIDVGIENYEEYWANDNFKRPSIAIFATWMINEALTLHDTDIDKEQAVLEKSAKALEDDMTDQALDLFG